MIVAILITSAKKAKARNGGGVLGRVAIALWRYRYLYSMLLPSLVFYSLFRFYPMLGNIIAFKSYKPFLGIWGSPWVGLEHFHRLFGDPLFIRALRNTAIIGFMKLVFTFPAPLILALFINEVRFMLYKRVVQTVVYVPHFLSWVIYAAILYIIFSPANGFVNNILVSLGFRKVHFFEKPQFFQPLVIISSILKESGWGAIIYLAAISAINPDLYEAAALDGASRWQVMRYVTMPGLAFTIVVLFIIQIGYFLNVGFEQVFVLQNPMVYTTGDIIETFIYRIGILQARFDFTTAAGFFNALVGMVMVLVADRLAKRWGYSGLL